MKAVTVEPDVRLAAYAGRTVDWQDAARVPATTEAGPLPWARAVFEGAPLPVRTFLVCGWFLMLLRPAGTRSDETHVLGWPVVETTATAAVLQRSSRLGLHATLLFSTDDDHVSFASAMVFDSWLGRAVWFAVAPVHRWAVRLTLAGARPGPREAG